MAKDLSEGILRRVKFLRVAVFGSRGKAAFARALGISPNTYEHYERETVPSPEVVARMFAATKVNPLWLYFGVEPSILNITSDRIEDAARMFARLLEGKSPPGNGSLLGEAVAEYGLGPEVEGAPWQIAAVRCLDEHTINIVKIDDADGPMLPYRGPSVDATINRPGA